MNTLNVVLCLMPSGELGCFMKLSPDGIMSFDTEMWEADKKQFQIVNKADYKDTKNLIIFSVRYLLDRRPYNVVEGVYETLCLL